MKPLFDNFLLLGQARIIPIILIKVNVGFLKVEIICGLNFYFELLHNFWLVLPFMNLAVDFFLEFEHWLANSLVIVVKSVLVHLLLNIRFLVKDRLDILLAQAIGIDMHDSFVGEFGALFKQILVAHDDALGSEPHMEVFGLLSRESNCIAASRHHRFAWVSADHVDLLIYLVTLLVDVFARFVETGLEGL